MRRWAMLGATVGLAALLGAQGAPERAPAPKAARAPIDWSERLERLDPAWPAAYFELAEEVADLAETDEGRGLARTLYAMAGALDREGHGRSAALALATLAEDPRRQRALIALAVLLSDGATNALESLPLDGPMGAGDRGPSAAAALELSEAFSFFRRGQGPRAASMTRAPEVDALLTRFGTGSPGGAERFREDCRVYKGGLRPSLSSDARTGMLAIEESVLASAGQAGEQRTWSSVLIETGGRPLIEIDAARLDEAFGIDVTRPYYRSGRWVAAP